MRGRVGEPACLGAAGESPCCISLLPSDRLLEKEARQLSSLEEHALGEPVGCKRQAAILSYKHSSYSPVMTSFSLCPPLLFHSIVRYFSWALSLVLSRQYNFIHFFPVGS